MTTIMKVTRAPTTPVPLRRKLKIFNQKGGSEFIHFPLFFI